MDRGHEARKVTAAFGAVRAKSRNVGRSKVVRENQKKVVFATKYKPSKAKHKQEFNRLYSYFRELIGSQGRISTWKNYDCTQKREKFERTITKK